MEHGATIMLLLADENYSCSLNKWNIDNSAELLKTEISQDSNLKIDLSPNSNLHIDLFQDRYMKTELSLDSYLNPAKGLCNYARRYKNKALYTYIFHEL
jgi:hypothetical protein